MRVFPELWDLVANLLTNREFWQYEAVRELDEDPRKAPEERQAEMVGGLDSLRCVAAGVVCLGTPGAG